ncbi:hypothetical protein [Pseudomonas sp. UBA1879]|uniref:hypothetical protein n=1 Tax=Pseudomonas sp. UBA1879 TaxID=1947305 RepID=UPI0025EE1ED8|nr:hypothetical protein [Pseudomonas sp. UBA1879]
MSKLKKSALIMALQSADWSGVSLGNKALIQAAIDELTGIATTNSESMIDIAKVEQMAAYYEAPEAFFDWLDLMRNIQTERAGDWSR